MRQVLWRQRVHMFLGFDSIALEHSDFPIASLHRHSNRRRWAIWAHLGRLNPAVFPRGFLLWLLAMLPLIMFLGGRDIVAIMIIHHPGVIQRWLLIAIVAGLSGVQHTPIRCQTVNRIRFRRSRTDVLKRQVARSYARVPGAWTWTGCNGSAIEFNVIF